ncbi:hypothetical protein B0H66DRAFT_520197 [Apodospora peruviana]|uniref:Uncharacterized protein n=1 Tax=Apodospora peruviana TaxID=516989 RepID=A0AAE0M2L0_9PEZI|nr:hypothetical protein B0H66DRAFT_520197 [Apodospora peruviana]
MHAAAAASSVGARMLSEVEETSLDEILTSLRTNLTNGNNNHNDSPDRVAASTSAPPPRTFPISRLNELVRRHFRATQSAPLAITGRHHELLYVLVATLIAPPFEKAVSIVDFDGRFDALRLLATAPYGDEIGVATAAHSEEEQGRIQAVEMSSSNRIVRRSDLDHVYILCPARGDLTHIADCIASMEEYMVYGSHRSRAREWWGTMVIGGGLNPAGGASAGHVAVTAGWRGWLRVDRAEVPAFSSGMSVEEALADREKRQAAVDDAGWVASCPWGWFTFGGSNSETNV